MRPLCPLAVSPLVALLAAAPAPAQTNNDGFLLAQPMGFTVKEGTRSTGGALVPHRSLLAKKAGLARGTAGPVLPGRPDFSWRALFPDPRTPVGAANIELDALSLGRDLLWVDPARPDGRIRHPDGQWLAIAFVVAHDSTGTKGIVAREQGLPGGAGADVFTYISTLSKLPARYPGKTFRSLDALDLELAPTTGDGQLASLDFVVPQYQLDDVFVNRVLPSQPYVWFSVTDASKARVPPPWWRDSASAPVAQSGAAIFRTQWTGSAWTQPFVWCRPDDLGLTTDDDVDALAIDTTHTDVHILFSTTDAPTPQPSQLMFLARSATDRGAASVYAEADGTPVADSAGAGKTIVGVCVEDPGPRQGPGNSYVWGTPEVSGLAGPLWVGTYRSCYSVTGIRRGRIESWVTGWGATGPNPTEWMSYWILVDDPTKILTVPIGPFYFQPRNAMSRNGDPHVIRLEDSLFWNLHGGTFWGLWISFGTSPSGFYVDIGDASRIDF